VHKRLAIDMPTNVPAAVRSSCKALVDRAQLVKVVSPDNVHHGGKEFSLASLAFFSGLYN
jgi:hypothetical protein